MKLRSTDSTARQYLVIDSKAEVIGNASESWDKKYWVLSLNDDPVSKRFASLAKLAEYIDNIRIEVGNAG